MGKVPVVIFKFQNIQGIVGIVSQKKSFSLSSVVASVRVPCSDFSGFFPLPPSKFVFAKFLVLGGFQAHAMQRLLADTPPAPVLTSRFVLVLHFNPFSM